MSRRTSIVKALATRFKLINGKTPYETNIFNNSFPKLKFWDEVNDFPCIYVVAGSENREYLPAGFKWAYLNVSLKVYTRGEDSQQKLETLIEDIEKCLDLLDDRLVYDSTNNYDTAEISITSITTDEGLLTPYAVGEVNLMIRYQVM